MHVGVFPQSHPAPPDLNLPGNCPGLIAVQCNLGTAGLRADSIRRLCMTEDKSER